MDREEWTLEEVLADLRAEVEDDMVEAEGSERIGAHGRAIWRRSHGEHPQTIIRAAERELGIQPKGEA